MPSPVASPCAILSEFPSVTDFEREFPSLCFALATGMGRTGQVPGTRELVIHKNYLAIYRVTENCVEILRIHHVAKLL